VAQRFYVETLGCPKNQVDSDKLVGTLLADGMTPTDDVALADLVVVNTCAFIDEARKESIDTILALEDQRKSGARLVVTGCMAERYGDELATAPARGRSGRRIRSADQPRPQALGGQHRADPDARPVEPAAARSRRARGRTSRSPKAAIAAADSAAIPSFRGPQRSRDVSSILAEVEQLEAQEIVLVAQDLASYGKDRPDEMGAGSIVPLVKAVSAVAPWTRLLYLYPSDLSDAFDRRDPVDRRGLLRPVAAARQQAAAAPHASVG
jgi:ribosomal protein S12 methylthiotransferase